MNWKRALSLLLIAGCTGARADIFDRVEVRQHAGARDLLAKKSIVLAAEGDVNTSFAGAMRLLRRQQLLPLLQRVYAEILPEGEIPEFTIEERGAGRYGYTNGQGQETEIEELCRQETVCPGMVLVYYSSGRRFFGFFQALTAVEVRPAADGRTRYRMQARVWPENTISRWVARTGVVEWFFERKAAELTRLAAEICAALPESDVALVRQTKNKEFL